MSPRYPNRPEEPANPPTTRPRTRSLTRKRISSTSLVALRDPDVPDTTQSNSSSPQEVSQVEIPTQKASIEEEKTPESDAHISALSKSDEIEAVSRSDANLAVISQNPGGLDEETGSDPIIQAIVEEEHTAPPKKQQFRFPLAKTRAPSKPTEKTEPPLPLLRAIDKVQTVSVPGISRTDESIEAIIQVNKGRSSQHGLDDGPISIEHVVKMQIPRKALDVEHVMTLEMPTVDNEAINNAPVTTPQSSTIDDEVAAIEHLMTVQTPIVDQEIATLEQQIMAQMPVTGEDVAELEQQIMAQMPVTGEDVAAIEHLMTVQTPIVDQEIATIEHMMTVETPTVDGVGADEEAANIERLMTLQMPTVDEEVADIERMMTIQMPVLSEISSFEIDNVANSQVFRQDKVINENTPSQQTISLQAITRTRTQNTIKTFFLNIFFLFLGTAFVTAIAAIMLFTASPIIKMAASVVLIIGLSHVISRQLKRMHQQRQPVFISTTQLLRAIYKRPEPAPEEEMKHLQLIKQDTTTYLRALKIDDIKKGTHQ